MIYQEKEVIDMLIKSCDLLLDRDSYLLEKHINERTLTHRLAVYLEEFFQEWNIDCEYNKNKHLPKRIKFSWLKRKISTGSSYGNIVCPDIIIHKRNSDNNFIVIEAKKDKDRRWKQWKIDDEMKLRAYVAKDDEYKYQYWFFIEFITWSTPWYKLSIMNENWFLEPINF